MISRGFCLPRASSRALSRTWPGEEVEISMLDTSSVGTSAQMRGFLSILFPQRGLQAAGRY